MAGFARSSDLRGAEFTGADLRGARFAECDLGGVVMRGVNADGVDIDDPFLGDGRSSVFVNGVDVVPLVEAELNHRFPGRVERRAEDPAGLRAAWAAAEQAWSAACARAAAMPSGTVDATVGGEWSFAQTQRHLVVATDVWLGRAILRIDQPFHPLGLPPRDPNDPPDEHGFDMSVFTAVEPTYAEVLAARASRVAMVRDFLATVTADTLAAARKNPYDPERPETVRYCLHVILREEWEHLRYAVRDLDALEAEPAG
jgi:hypothetical protein